MKINFSLLGSEEMILEEVAHKDAFLHSKFPEAHIIEDLPPVPIELPSWIAPREPKRPLLSFFRLVLP